MPSAAPGQYVGTPAVPAGGGRRRAHLDCESPKLYLFLGLSCCFSGPNG